MQIARTKLLVQLSPKLSIWTYTHSDLLYMYLSYANMKSKPISSQRTRIDVVRAGEERRNTHFPNSPSWGLGKKVKTVLHDQSWT